MRQRIGKIVLCISLLIVHLQLMGNSPKVFSASAMPPKLVAGYYHTVALASEGQVYSWGGNDRGQLGNGMSNNRNTPGIVTDLDQIMEIDSGVRSSMALRADGTVWTWGMNENGQLGIGTFVNTAVPTKVTALEGTRITAISGRLGYHSMALAEDGTVWTWGENDSGELGDGTKTLRNVPVQVQGLDQVAAIAAGGYYSLALKEDGTVWAWGTNQNGELGDGTFADKLLPVQVSGLSDVSLIAVGGSHSLAVKQDGTVWAWGSNRQGELGDGTITNRSKPVKVLNLENIVDIAGGGYHSLALDADGNVWSWGLGNYGQLGRTGTASDRVPARISDLTSVIDISAGGFHSLAMTKDMRVWGWGYNGYGQLGDGTWSTSTVPVLSKAFLDTTAPVPGGLIKAIEVTTDSIELQWAAASDNLDDSDELEYRLYVSGRDNLSTVEEVEQNGMALGTYEKNQTSAALQLLVPDQTYYFNVIVKDSTGNKSVYPMLSVKTRPPAPLHDPTLRQLSVQSTQESGLALNPGFNRYEYTYDLRLDEATDRLSVTADVYDTDASVTASVYDMTGQLLQGPILLVFGEPSEEITLVEEAAYLLVSVSTPDGQEQEYLIALIRDSVPGGNPGEGPDDPGEGPGNPGEGPDDPGEGPGYPGEGPDRPGTGGGSGPERSGQPSGGSVSQPPARQFDLQVLLNLQPQEGLVHAGLRNDGNQQVVSLRLDSAKLKATLEMTGSDSSLILILEQQADLVELSMDAQAAELFAERKGSMELRSPLGGFRFAAAELAESFERYGAETVKEADDQAIVTFTLGGGTGEVQKQLARAEAEQHFMALLSPVEFKGVIQIGEHIHSIEKWGRYVQRSLPVPPEQANDATTGVFIGKDDTVIPVPTRIETLEDGSRHAVLKSMYNGSFALISKRVLFADASSHWSNEAVHDLASRLITTGTAEGQYSPEAPMERAAFAVLMTRALGLYDPSVPVTVFGDVSDTDWFHAPLALAAEHGLIQGDAAGNFHPRQAISRQEAIAVIARAIEAEEFPGTAQSSSSTAPGLLFKDLDSLPDWARAAAEKLVNIGVLEGSPDGMLMPKQALTRGEAAALIQRMLDKNGMID
ncbi:S-layer homology domain-containing protein [Paenibacillus vini]|uniref:RCC1 domain-containing protein n=1 Tax=Paenibacillus vini TaxID=1476024 RepID=UPI0025B70794|nr:S-layer homology domain-containing protein [Paenibacillus vini]MDN4071386.1 S-layer homology domain-containing protein [Paenibacillus vini]